MTEVFNKKVIRVNSSACASTQTGVISGQK